MLLGYAYYKRGSIDRKQFVQRNIKTEFSKFEKYKDAIPHGGCVLLKINLLFISCRGASMVPLQEMS